MGYIFAFVFIFLSSGILFSHLYTIEIPIYLLFVILLFSVLIRGFFSVFLLAIFLFLLGIFVYPKNEFIKQEKIKGNPEIIFVECNVSSIPKKKFDDILFKCKIINSDKKVLINKISTVYIKDSLNNEIYLGSKLAFFGKWSLYDQKLYLFPLEGFIIVDNSENIFYKLFQFRKYLMQNYSNNTYSQEAYSLGLALVFGEKGDIPQDLRNIFIETGLIHLLAISGMHVAIFVSLLFFIFSFLKEPLRNKLILSVIPFYAFLTGFNLPVIRASFMALLYFLGRSLFWKVDLLHLLFLAGSVVVLFSPLSLFSPSFQLSFAATLGIILALKDFPVFEENRLYRYLLLPIYTSFVAVLFTLPILIFHFGGFSFSGIFLTPLVLPILYLYLFFSSLNLFSFFLIKPLVFLMDFVGLFFIKSVSFLQSFSLYFSGFSLNVFSAVVLFFALLLIFTLKLNIYQRLFTSFLILFIILLVSKENLPKYEVFSFEKKSSPDIVFIVPQKECFFSYRYANSKIEKILKKKGCVSEYFFSKRIDFNGLILERKKKGILIQSDTFKLFIKNKSYNFYFYP